MHQVPVIQHDGRVGFGGNGKLSIHDEAFKQKSILPEPLTAYGFSHPRIVSLGLNWTFELLLLEIASSTGNSRQNFLEEMAKLL